QSCVAIRSPHTLTYSLSLHDALPISLEGFAAGNTRVYQDAGFSARDDGAVSSAATGQHRDRNSHVRQHSWMRCGKGVTLWLRHTLVWSSDPKTVSVWARDPSPANPGFRMTTSVELPTLKQIVYCTAYQRAAVGPGDTGKKGQEGFVDLPGIGSLRHHYVGQQFDNWDKDSNHNDPAIRPIRTQCSQEHTGS